LLKISDPDKLKFHLLFDSPATSNATKMLIYEPAQSLFRYSIIYSSFSKPPLLIFTYLAFTISQIQLAFSFIFENLYILRIILGLNFHKILKD
jgi:hypothetical protein